MSKIPDKQENGWNEWSRHVLSELQRLNGWSAEMAERQTTILVQISELKTEMKFRAGIWGLIAGAIPTTIGLVIWLIKT